jgi:DNA-binding response OmpR family regulator
MDRFIQLPVSIHPRSGCPAVTVVGLQGHVPVRALRRAGYAVSQDPTVEFAHLDHSDLLVLAPGPPEPPAWALIGHLRERSGIPVIALMAAPTDDERRRSTDAGADRCLDVAGTDADLVAEAQGLLRDRVAGHREQGRAVPSRGRQEHVPA